MYSRTGNPNRRQLEDILTTLEGGAACAAFSSGSAASSAVFQLLATGDHVVAPNDCYHGTHALLRDVFAGWGLQVTFADVTDPEQVRRAMQPNTRLVWVETPSNPMLKVTDIRRTAEMAHEARALCVCDNTWATPMLQQPISLGVDAVVHSTTKYISGHSDVMGGAVIAAREDDFLDRLRHVQAAYGAVPSAFDCWMTLRGIRTLHLRMRAHCENAGAVASFLSEHPRVAAVHYPGLAAPEEQAVAATQMSDFGGMLSFQVVGGKQEALDVTARLHLFTRATSLGGTESLIEHRA